MGPQVAATALCHHMACLINQVRVALLKDGTFQSTRRLARHMGRAHKISLVPEQPQVGGVGLDETSLFQGQSCACPVLFPQCRLAHAANKQPTLLLVLTRHCSTSCSIRMLANNSILADDGVFGRSVLSPAVKMACSICLTCGWQQRGARLKAVLLEAPDRTRQPLLVALAVWDACKCASRATHGRCVRVCVCVLCGLVTRRVRLWVLKQCSTCIGDDA